MWRTFWPFTLRTLQNKSVHLHISHGVRCYPESTHSVRPAQVSYRALPWRGSDAPVPSTTTSYSGAMSSMAAIEARVGIISAASRVGYIRHFQGRWLRRRRCCGEQLRMRVALSIRLGSWVACPVLQGCDYQHGSIAYRALLVVTLQAHSDNTRGGALFNKYASSHKVQFVTGRPQRPIVQPHCFQTKRSTQNVDTRKAYTAICIYSYLFHRNFLVFCLTFSPSDGGFSSLFIWCSLGASLSSFCCSTLAGSGS